MAQLGLQGRRVRKVALDKQAGRVHGACMRKIGRSGAQGSGLKPFQCERYEDERHGRRLTVGTDGYAKPLCMRASPLQATLCMPVPGAPKAKVDRESKARGLKREWEEMRFCMCQGWDSVCRSAYSKQTGRAFRRGGHLLQHRWLQ